MIHHVGFFRLQTADFGSSPFLHGQMETEYMALALPEPEETLIDDPRGRLRPAQMAENKLLVSLDTCPAALSTQGMGRPLAVPWKPRRCNTPAHFF
jgi:hypothetical protein